MIVRIMAAREARPAWPAEGAWGVGYLNVGVLLRHLPWREAQRISVVITQPLQVVGEPVHRGEQGPGDKPLNQEQHAGCSMPGVSGPLLEYSWEQLPIGHR